jgi:hypothetical protein
VPLERDRTERNLTVRESGDQTKGESIFGLRCQAEDAPERDRAKRNVTARESRDQAKGNGIFSLRRQTEDALDAARD